MQRKRERKKKEHNSLIRETLKELRKKLGKMNKRNKSIKENKNSNS